MTAEVASPERPLSRSTDFLKLWGGQTVSLFGSYITELALPLTAVLVLHASAGQMGLLGTARWLPYLLFTLWVGALADRVRRLPLLIGVDVGRALAMGAIVTLALTGRLTFELLLALVFVFGAMTVVFDVSWYSFVPYVVSREQLIGANSRLQASSSVAQVGGPSLGGLLVQLVTAPYALLADAISFVVSALSLISIRVEEPKPEPDPDTAVSGSLARIREGLSITYRNPFLRAFAGVAGFYNLFELGGNSLQAAQLISWIRRRFDTQIALADFFRAPTPANIANLVDRQRIAQMDDAELVAFLESIPEEEAARLLAEVTAGESA